MEGSNGIMTKRTIVRASRGILKTGPFLAQREKWCPAHVQPRDRAEAVRVGICIASMLDGIVFA